MRSTKSPKALLCVSLLLTIILVAGASCCHLDRRIPDGHAAPNVYDSFIYVESTNYVKRCVDDSCMEGVRVGSGSGFAIKNMGDYTLAATAGHLCAPLKDSYKQEVRVTVLGGEVYRAVIALVVVETDTCILAIPGASIPTLPIAQEDVRRGEKVYAIGAPFGIFDDDMIATFEGFYAGSTSTMAPPGGLANTQLLLNGYTVPSRPGSSGGPILNSRGEVVGMMILAHPLFETFTLSPRQGDLREVLEFVIKMATAEERSNE